MMRHLAKVGIAIDLAVLELLSHAPYSQRQLHDETGYSLTGIRHSLLRQIEAGLVHRTKHKYGCGKYRQYLFVLEQVVPNTEAEKQIQPRVEATA